MIKYICYLLLFILSFFGAFAGLFLKKGTEQFGKKNFFKIWQLYVGGLCYAAGAVINIYVLKYLDYSVVMPMMSITYIWTTALSVLVLKEQLTARKLLGLALIIIGVFLIAWFH